MGNRPERCSTLSKASSSFDEYVTWYSWAWMNLVREVVVCHTAAAAAVQTLAAGGDRSAVSVAALEAAADVAAVGRTRAGYGTRHRYVERFIWARSNLGLCDLHCHDVARVAMGAVASRSNARSATEDAARAIIVEDLMQTNVGACTCEGSRTGLAPRKSDLDEDAPRALEAS